MRCLLLPVGFVILLSACHQERTRVVDTCGTSCFPHDPRLLGVGVCHAGTISCTDGGAGVCVDSVGPAAEICDGLDNDCDGVIDNFQLPCTDACGAGVRRCLDGNLGSCFSRAPSPEVCNGIDDDCDGEIDEAGDLPVEFCYTGPDRTVLHGDCHPGTVRCVDSMRTCVGEKTPTPEQCDGIDNNCNGAVDEGPVAGNNVDVVIILDTSQSMGRLIANVQTASQAWASKYAGNSGLRFALITAPDTDAELWCSQVRLFGDFAEAAVFQGWMSHQLAASGSTAEPTLDALIDVSNEQHLFSASPGGAGSEKLSWRPGARRVAILFTDEVGQSYNYQPPVTPAAAAAAATAAGITIHVFTALGNPDVVSSFEPIVVATGGKLKDVGSEEAELESELESLIRLEICH